MQAAAFTPTLALPSRKVMTGIGIFLALIVGLMFAAPSYALDLVAFISLAALRNFGPVLFYLGMAIFGAVGLTIAGAILGAVI